MQRQVGSNTDSRAQHRIAQNQPGIACAGGTGGVKYKQLRTTGNSEPLADAQLRRATGRGLGGLTKNTRRSLLMARWALLETK